MAPRLMLLPITWVPISSQYPSWVAFLVFPLTTISHVFLRFRVIRFSIALNILHLVQRWVRRPYRGIQRDSYQYTVLYEKVLVGYAAMMSFTMMENKTGPKTGLVSNKMSSFQPPDSAKSVTSETQTDTDNPAESNPRSTPKERCGLWIHNTLTML